MSYWIYHGIGIPGATYMLWGTYVGSGPTIHDVHDVNGAEQTKHLYTSRCRDLKPCVLNLEVTLLPTEP